MKRIFSALSLLLLAIPLASYATEHLVPAGSLVQCMVAEPKLSSKTTAIGDPVLCRVRHMELYGRSVFPYDSYLVGYFEDYKDPGHLVGKGWMELKFDRMVIEPDTVIPISAKVVAVPKYNVDREGRILGNGHPVRDTIEWLIPVLWPIDLINLPRRGPRPVLKAETLLTLKLMDDIGIPDREQPQAQGALIERVTPPAPQPTYAPQPQPQPAYYAPPPQPSYYAPPPEPTYYAPPPAPQQVIYEYNAAPEPVVVVAPQVAYPYYPPPPPPVQVVIPYGYGYGYGSVGSRSVAAYRGYGGNSGYGGNRGGGGYGGYRSRR